MRHRKRSILVGSIVLGTYAALVNGQRSSDPVSWPALKAAYDYSVRPDLTVKVETRRDGEFVLEHVSFKNARGQTVPGLFLRPKAPGRYACVLLLHGLTSNKETMTAWFGRPLAQRGIASLALDADRHGERQSPNRSSGIQVLGEIVHGGIVDYRMAMDYLKTRKDVDPKRIGLLGYSMGAIMGTIVSGVDDRVKATVLCVGGDAFYSGLTKLGEPMRRRMASVSCACYVGHISPRPLLMINGKKDMIIREDATRTLYDAAKSPKELIWSDSGHILPADATRKGVEWLAKRL